MSAFKSTTIANGQAVTDKEMVLQSVLLTAAAADATVTIKGAGNTEVIIAAKAGTSESWPSGMGNDDFTFRIPGPVTLDLTGTGAFTRVQY